MRPVSMKIVSIATAAAIMFVPTAAAASAVQSSPPPSSAWVTLSQLNPAGATALAAPRLTASSNAISLAGAAAAAQPVADSDLRRPDPLPLPVIAVLLAVLATAIYIAFIEDHDGDRVFLISPQ